MTPLTKASHIVSLSVNQVSKQTSKQSVSQSKKAAISECTVEFSFFTFINHRLLLIFFIISVFSYSFSAPRGLPQACNSNEAVTCRPFLRRVMSCPDRSPPVPPTILHYSKFRVFCCIFCTVFSIRSSPGGMLLCHGQPCVSPSLNPTSVASSSPDVVHFMLFFLFFLFVLLIFFCLVSLLFSRTIFFCFFNLFLDGCKRRDTKKKKKACSIVGNKR